MRKPKPLELQRGRNFGENFSVTFSFLKLNVKPLLQGMLFMAGPLIMVQAILFVFLFRDYFSLTVDIDTGPFIDDVRFKELLFQLLVDFGFMYLAVVQVSIIGFIVLHLYNKHGEPPSINQIWEVYRRKYLTLLGAKLLMMPFIVFPGVLFLLPGFAFYTLFGGVEMSILDRDEKIFSAFSQTFELMGNYFWLHLGLNFVMVLLAGLLGALMDVPVAVFDGSRSFFSAELEVSGWYEVFLNVLKVFGRMVGYFIFVIPTISIGLQYYANLERKEGRSIMEKINLLGVPEEPQNIYAEDEQY